MWFNSAIFLFSKADGEILTQRCLLGCANYYFIQKNGTFVNPFRGCKENFSRFSAGRILLIQQAGNTSSEQAPYLSLLPFGKSPLTPLLLLSPPKPLTRKGYAAAVSGKAANGCAVAGFRRGPRNSPAKGLLFIQQAGHAGQLLTLQELQGGAAASSKRAP